MWRGGGERKEVAEAWRVAEGNSGLVSVEPGIGVWVLLGGSFG